LRTPGIEPQLAANDFAQMWPFFERFGGATWLTPALRDQYRQAWSATPSPSPLAAGDAGTAIGTTSAPLATSALTGPLNYYRASPLHPPTSPQDAIHTLQLPDALLHVPVPTSVVWGEADTALPPSLLDGLSEYVRDLHITRLPHATHWLVHEAPQAVIAAIEAALQRR
jgi:pimeloyl-ACP methyl ester carboxylesterase